MVMNVVIATAGVALMIVMIVARHGVMRMRMTDRDGIEQK
jgi:hypothetical protein